MLLTPAQIKPKPFKSRRNSSFFSLSFFTLGGCASCLRACLGARLLLQSYQYPNLSEGASRVRGQLRGDKECPFSGVTKSGRVWRKVPESDDRSVISTRTPSIAFKSRSFCQKCRWQVTAKHAYTLRMWLLLNRASALVTTCP